MSSCRATVMTFDIVVRSSSNATIMLRCLPKTSEFIWHGIGAPCFIVTWYTRGVLDWECLLYRLHRIVRMTFQGRANVTVWIEIHWLGCQVEVEVWSVAQSVLNTTGGMWCDLSFSLWLSGLREGEIFPEVVLMCLDQYVWLQLELCVCLSVRNTCSICGELPSQSVVLYFGLTRKTRQS